MKYIYSAAILFLFAMKAFAQGRGEAEQDVKNTTLIAANETKSDDDTTKKNKHYLQIGSGGIKMGGEEDTDKVFDIQIGMVDLGINYLQDRTNYNDPAVQDFLHVNNEMKNDNLFSLREGKSINVNVYPILAKFRAIKTPRQRMYIALGLGLQMYNFRFNKPVTYLNETTPMVGINDSLHFTKNKVGLTYLSMPLMFNFKTKLAKKVWVVYGAGITAGYRIDSWTKQVSVENGKEKNHDQFNFNNFNSCVTAEFGLEGYFRLYASYQLTALHEDTLDQHPYAIGVRFLGI